ncbi:hypothetical protein Aph01nite_26180 [Acrocarpospora phusangensis]|uniref:Uncharacterized protein n=1 Tax=Acrocarpospora phusangensis TaxID=1070424 RepID=A0A919Q957_9ACTN|nr:hypothetical protein [Acrocarpospora phusangensis]GIH24308.1 hypothetical protein Aph01nite_26180 [Acrocarpospora phusangensis]
MFKKIAATGAVLAATCGAVLLAAPAQADTWTKNTSRNSDSAQSGNNFGHIAATNVGSRGATNVININGIAGTATRGGSVGLSYRFDD